MGWRLAREFGILALGATLIAGTANGDDSCLKLVFGRYCLGGDIERALRSAPSPLARQSQGDSLALVYPDGANRLYLLAFENRIYKVVRAYETATQLKFDDLYNQLREKYGLGEDRSRFPEYASTPAFKLASIRRGEGRAIHHWDASNAWYIELSWTREMGIALSYIATEIDARRATQIEGGL
ncbi:hypothetical protein [Imhoffiella purpurea]|uniref:Uncharacterized protein n=1 Tax=Imhoffiella purpurea TaxID=1249627 RepID=W9V8Y1_9GAMM|nr:hypothetical protein [Imhoffiella purpurea]EXJ13306.1 hypothetical protein D779_3897 [Imhoffiella purpurea]